MSFTRRSFMTAAGAAALLGARRAGAMGSRAGMSRAAAASGTQTKSGLMFGYTPFTQDLFIPEIATSLAPGTLSPTPAAIAARGPIAPSHSPGTHFDDVAHGIAPEFGLCDDWNKYGYGTHVQEFELINEETTHRFFPGGPDVPIFSYRDPSAGGPGTGTTPGPTFVLDYRAPVVLRNSNALTRDRSGTNSTHHDHETSIHLHGTHGPAHSDGYPSFYTLAGESRDYFYPNIAPREADYDTGLAPATYGEFDEAWIPTTLWYHDHAMDVTGFNVSRGLAGFYLVWSEKEHQLADMGVIPGVGDLDAFGNPLDFGLALQDQRFNADGTIHYDFLDHNGRLGDVFTVNGVAQPRHKVQRRKYRLRFLNASNARVYEIRLSNRQKMTIVGTDSWLLPHGIEVESFQLVSGQRHDVIIDFRDAPDEVYIENLMYHEDGRGGSGIREDKRTQLLKFEVSGSNSSEPRCEEGTVIRGFHGIDPGGQFSFHDEDEVLETRSFVFKRNNGAFTVNGRLFNPRRADAVPPLGVGAERWIFENHSGGWWHPIHTHLEGFQIKKVNGKPPRRERQFNSDTVELQGHETVETIMKFRTFSGPFVFHCHNIEHEDMRMMGTHDPTPVPGSSDADAIDGSPPMDGETRIDPAVSGVVPDCHELEEEERLYYDVAGDSERLEGRGVGFPECEFDVKRRGNRGRSSTK